MRPLGWCLPLPVSFTYAAGELGPSLCECTQPQHPAACTRKLHPVHRVAALVEPCVLSAVLSTQK